jgi:hypothetical protein
MLIIIRVLFLNCFPFLTVPTCTRSIVQTSTEQKQNKSEMYVWTRL